MKEVLEKNNYFKIGYFCLVVDVKMLPFWMNVTFFSC